MARNEQDREDLLREATALRERVELQVDGFPDPIVVGFRSHGAASFFFGGDPVYQFLASGELRRAYRNGRLLKAENGHLIELTRNRTPEAVELLRRHLPAGESRALLDEASANLKQLRDSLAARAFSVVGQVPSHTDVTARVLDWLSRYGDPLEIARSPHVRGDGGHPDRSERGS